MQQTTRHDDPPHPYDRLGAHLADAGYAPVLRHGDDKRAAMPGHFTCGEYWRLDDPRRRALVTLDLAQGSVLSVTFRQSPRISGLRRLLDLFRTQAQDAADMTVRADALEDAMAAIPGGDDLSPAHKQLAQALYKSIRPIFFIDPDTSTDSRVMLNAHVEADLAGIIAAEGGRVAFLNEDARLKHMGRVGARQIMGTSVVTLDVPTAGRHELVLTARRMVMRSYQSPPQHMRFEQFINDHAALICAQVQICQSSRALQTPLPPR